jgi:hypothetical protein
VTPAPLSPLSPLTLPLTATRLAVRYFVPLALWYTLGELIKWALSWASYELGLRNSVTPILFLGLTVAVGLTVTVLMLHSVRESLPAVRARSFDESLAPWRGRDRESLLDAVSRSLFPFVIIYFAWGLIRDDALKFARAASGRGLAEGGLEGSSQGLGQTFALDRRMGLAIALALAFFVLKTVTERLLLSRYPRTAGIAVAVFEINWALIAIITFLRAVDGVTSWITGRAIWNGTIGQIPNIPVVGDAFTWLTDDLWPMFTYGVLLALVWLIVAGLVLGAHLTDEDPLLARSRRLGKAFAWMRKLWVVPANLLEELTQEFLREKWVPAVNGVRLVRHAGVVTFGVICVLYAGVSVLDDLGRRAIYVLVGAETLAWWAPRAVVVGFVVGLVVEILRICLLAAAFDLMVARVAAKVRSAAAGPPPGQPSGGPPPGQPSGGPPPGWVPGPAPGPPPGFPAGPPPWAPVPAPAMPPGPSGPPGPPMSGPMPPMPGPGPSGPPG